MAKNNSTITCKYCKTSKHVRMMLYLHVSAPVGMFHNLTKKNLAKKEFSISAALWDTADLLCDKCGVLLSSGRPMRYYTDEELKK